MRFLPKSTRLGLLVLLVCTAALLTAFVSAAAGATTLTLQETNKGSSATFIDNPPETVPHAISAGDEFVVRKPLLSGGKRIGTTILVCVVTNTTRNIAKAESLCTVTFKFGKIATLTAVGLNKGITTSGAITGGTGSYVGARGSFESKESRSGATTTITLE